MHPDTERMLALKVRLDEVRESPDLRRVRALPIERWQDRGEELAAKWTAKLRRPGGTVKLRPIQGAMLEAAATHGGVFAPARTGAGKQLFSLLVAAACGHKRPVVLLPASRKEPTYEAIREYAKEFTFPAPMLISYTDLSQEARQDILVRANPDVIVADEAHNLKNEKGPRWRRVQRVPGNVPLLPISGTFANRDMLEYSHLVRRALEGGAPVPHEWEIGVEWSRALNPRSKAPLGPGALLTLMSPAPTDGLGFEAARSRFGRRFVSSPGVVSSGSDVPDIPLHLRRLEVPPSREMKDAYQHMESTWMTPCDFPIDTALDMARHMTELSCGFYYRWREIPPPEWLAARKALAKWIRAVTAEGDYDLASEVLTAVKHGAIEDPGVVASWERVEPMYTPDMVPVWFCDSTLQIAARWLREHGGIVWVGHSTFGERLSKNTGVPFFREGARSPEGVHIEKHRGPAICSLHSCGTGHNLQHYSRMLYTTTPPPTLLEQSISRLHREPREGDVHADFLVRLPNDLRAIERAQEDADTLSRTFQVTQRVIYGEWV